MATRIALLVLVVGTVACGGSTAAPTPVQAAITVTVSPNPATSTVCSPACVATNGSSYQFRAAGTLVIQETAGVGGNVDSIVSGTLTYTSADVMQRSGSSRLEPKGALPFALAFVYGAEGNANASRSIVFPFVVTVTDDRGNHVTGLVQWTAN
jgi:hypothetical protein